MRHHGLEFRRNRFDVCERDDISSICVRMAEHRGIAAQSSAAIMSKAATIPTHVFDSAQATMSSKV